MKRNTIFTVIASSALLAYAVVLHFYGEVIATRLSDKFGSSLSAVSNGKFEDPATFILGRLWESLWLSLALFGLVISFVWLSRRLRRHSKNPGRVGLINGVLAFVAFNLFVWACGQTVLFWSLFYNKRNVDNFAQYQIKRLLLDEVHDRQRVILIGNSQTNRSIDEIAINSALKGKLWATELTQPGARGFDMLILARDIPLRKGDWVVSYISEISFYGAGSGIVAADFLHFGEIRDLNEMQGWEMLSPGSARSGLLGRLLPLYRYRNSLSRRFLGAEAVGIRQRRHDSSLTPNLDELAEITASKLSIGKGSDFEKKSFARLADQLADAGCRFIIIRGALHPALEDRLEDGVSDDLDGFLSALGTTHPQSVAVIDGEGIMPTDEESFDDLVHFTKEAQARFSASFAEALAHQAGKKGIGSGTK